MKLNKNQKFWAELVVLPNNQIKVKKAQKYNRLNQYVGKWMVTNARNLAREIKKHDLITN